MARRRLWRGVLAGFAVVSRATASLSSLLLESGDHLLLEDGSKILLE